MLAWLQRGYDELNGVEFLPSVSVVLVEVVIAQLGKHQSPMWDARSPQGQGDALSLMIMVLRLIGFEA